MQKHTQIYLDSFGLDKSDNNSFVPSEISSKRAVDIHHIIGRGKKGEDRIENLMALTRDEHQDYGDEKDYMVLLLKIHQRFLDLNDIPYNEGYFNFYINKYQNQTGLKDVKKI